jgi:hypothetical protein
LVDAVCSDYRSLRDNRYRGEAVHRRARQNILLFFAAPFLGLAYIVALPFVGLGFLAVVAVRTAAKIEAVRTVGLALKNVVMLIAAPFVGLTYIVFFPVIGLTMLAWMGGRAAVEAGAR